MEPRPRSTATPRQPLIYGRLEQLSTGEVPLQGWALRNLTDRMVTEFVIWGTGEGLKVSIAGAAF